MVAVPARFDVESDVVLRRPSPTFTKAITTGPASLKPIYDGPVPPVRTPLPPVQLPVNPVRTPIDIVIKPTQIAPTNEGAVTTKAIKTPQTGGADTFGMTPEGGPVSAPTQPPTTGSGISGLFVAGIGVAAY